MELQQIPGLKSNLNAYREKLAATHSPLSLWLSIPSSLHGLEEYYECGLITSQKSWAQMLCVSTVPIDMAGACPCSKFIMNLLVTFYEYSGYNFLEGGTLE